MSFRPEKPYLGTFRQELEKTIVTFEISIFEFDKIQSIILNEKKNFATKIALFRYFWTGT